MKSDWADFFISYSSNKTLHKMMRYVKLACGVSLGGPVSPKAKNTMLRLFIVQFSSNWVYRPIACGVRICIDNIIADFEYPWARWVGPGEPRWAQRLKLLFFI